MVCSIVTHNKVRHARYRRWIISWMYYDRYRIFSNGIIRITCAECNGFLAEPVALCIEIHAVVFVNFYVYVGISIGEIDRIAIRVVEVIIEVKY